MSSFEDILTPDVRFHLVRKMERHKVIGLAGPRLLPHERKYLEFHNVAGIILFQRNVQSLSQVTDFIATVCEALPEGGPQPLVMADHEGDVVSELREIIGAPPSALAIAATGDVDLAREVARQTGEAMRKVGVNVVLAPVADLFLDAASAVTGLRTFGRDPERVGEMVRASIEGYGEAGILSCVKHFPGHGATPEDSHETLPEVARSLDELRAADLVPFRAAIHAGVEMVMMSHVAFPFGGEQLVPASFDPRIIRTLLRDELRFDGVVITDSLEMAGARWYAQGRHGSMGGSFERSLLAGSDILLHTRPIPEQVQLEGERSPVMSIGVMDTIIKTLEKVVDRERVDEKLAEAAKDIEPLANVLSILNQSQTRVEKLRACAASAPARPASSGKVIQLGAYPTVPAVYRSVAERALVAPRGWNGVVETLEGRRGVVVPIEAPGSALLKKHDLEAFVDQILRQFPDWERTQVVVGFEHDGESIEPVFAPSGRQTVIDATRYTGSGGAMGSSHVELGEDDALVLVFATRGEPDVDFREGLQMFAQDQQPDLVIVAGWPVEDWVPETSPVLLSLGASAQAASAVASALSGLVEPTGSLVGLVPGH